VLPVALALGSWPQLATYGSALDTTNLQTAWDVILSYYPPIQPFSTCLCSAFWVFGWSALPFGCRQNDRHSAVEAVCQRGGRATRLGSPPPTSNAPRGSDWPHAALKWGRRTGASGSQRKPEKRSATSLVQALPQRRQVLKAATTTRTRPPFFHESPLPLLPQVIPPPPQSLRSPAGLLSKGHVTAEAKPLWRRGGGALPGCSRAEVPKRFMNDPPPPFALRALGAFRQGPALCTGGQIRHFVVPARGFYFLLPREAREGSPSCASCQFDPHASAR